MERESKKGLNFGPKRDTLFLMIEDKRKFLRFECLVRVEEIQSEVKALRDFLSRLNGYGKPEARLGTVDIKVAEEYA